MILIDTNHLTVLKYPEDSEHETLVRRMEASADQDFAIPIIVVEEQLRGWLAVIHSAREERKQINAYAWLSDLILFSALGESSVSGRRHSTIASVFAQTVSVSGRWTCGSRRLHWPIERRS